MKDWKFYLTASFLIIVTTVALYFSFVNSIFSNKILVNVNVQGNVQSFLPEAQLKEMIALEASKLLPQQLNFQIDNTQFTIPTNDLEPRIDITKITSFGKGNDLAKVLGDSISLISGEIINREDLNFVFNTEKIISNLPYKETEKAPAYLEGTYVRNCANNSYIIDYNEDAISDLIADYVLNNKSLRFSLDDIVNSQDEIEVVNYCKYYNEQIAMLNGFIGTDLPWEDYLDFNLASNNKSRLELNNSDQLRTALLEIANRYYKEASSGEYFVENNNLYLYENFTAGQELDIDNTIGNIALWIDNPKPLENIIAYNEVLPDYYNDYNVIDVTKVIGKGESRLDIIRDGYVNYRVGHSQRALEVVDNFVLDPGQEFSFYNDTGIKSRQIIVGIGVCNASTTMFRLALNAGFDITDRSPHTFYVLSYDYPKYPINNVEATFFGGPVVDLKFKNDLDYPVILKTTIDRSPNDGYQYHTVTAYTSPDAPTRTVELVDFKKWSVVSAHKFKSSFVRKVYDINGDVLKENTYAANYYD